MKSKPAKAQEIIYTYLHLSTPIYTTKPTTANSGEAGSDAVEDCGVEVSATDECTEHLFVFPSPAEQWLLVQLFWEERTEAEVGKALGISQRAVGKRKQVISQKMCRPCTRYISHKPFAASRLTTPLSSNLYRPAVISRRHYQPAASNTCQYEHPSPECLPYTSPDQHQPQAALDEAPPQETRADGSAQSADEPQLP